MKEQLEMKPVEKEEKKEVCWTCSILMKIAIIVISAMITYYLLKILDIKDGGK